VQIDRKHLAVHKLVDFYGCNPMVLQFAKYLEPVMQEAATKAGCAIVGVKAHQFNPIGATVMVLVAESHLSIHTWPEKGQALVDVFASGDMDLDAAVNHIARAIEATSRRVTTIERG
jgi:S-adenosylmethionine decarboxylase proenzyme